ncbi:hypothetical protein GA0070618_5424 [Micromonospora echinospora]|uniref:Uncharacterized protein n=1 Tax=Micromonospora echinospora TaxID=1877 RepID=A0A1C4ZKZ2_MICEC|nr:hypothetical protein [Micromonospora echinospora]SCF33663.1 hypothetical protein GA0070618_5424 [Micromonospora echinospora]
MATITTIQCECYGANGTQTVPAPSGGEMDACRRCRRYEWRQPRIDALAALS